MPWRWTLKAADRKERNLTPLCRLRLPWSTWSTARTRWFSAAMDAARIVHAACSACIASAKTRTETQKHLSPSLAAALWLAFTLPAAPFLSGVANAAAAAEDVATVQVIDGEPVLFQYGRPVPAFLLPETLPPQRSVISLDGEWSFAPDPDGLWAGPGSGADLLAWRPVLVPHVWDHEPGLESFDGPVWYRKRFELPETTEGQRVRLVFLGAADEATVYVNGTRAGYHRGAYIPFALDVTELVRPGEENEVTVHLRRRIWGIKEQKLLPPGDHDWTLYGGLFQSVYVEMVPELSVARILAGYRSGTMKSVVVLHNEGPQDREVIVRFDPGWNETGAKDGSATLPLTVETTVRTGRTAVVAFELPAGPHLLWTPANPRVFTSTAEVVDKATLETIDLWQEHYGLVDVAVSGTQLRLAGRRLFIKGVNWHVDHPEVGAAYRLEHFQKDFELMLSAGANFVRFSHYPRHPAAYRLADQLGLMVMDESPNYWMDRLDFLYQLDDGLSATYVRSMVWNHMNHPSVILWSVLNESETGVRGGTAVRDFLSELTGAVRTLDLSGRPVTYASNHHRDDIGFGFVDVIGVNEYYGFFYGSHDDVGPYLDYLHSRYPNKPVLIIEFGDWAVYGSSRQSTQSWTFQEHWRQFLERSDFVAGGIWWVFADHKSRHQPTSAIPYISTMGMFDRNRRPKTLFRVFRDAALPADAWTAHGEDDGGR